MYQSETRTKSALSFFRKSYGGGKLFFTISLAVRDKDEDVVTSDAIATCINNNQSCVYKTKYNNFFTLITSINANLHQV